MKNQFPKSLTALMTVVLLTSQVFAQSDISGQVLYHLKANRPIPLVELNLVDEAGNVTATATTDLSGAYTFVNVPYGNYTITATTSITAGGITMGDAFLMFLHLCNLYPFTPIQELAADVDGDGSVTWNDYWTVVIGWFVQGYPFPAGPWVFEDVLYAHTGAKANPPAMGGSSAGDVNGTFVPSTRDLAVIEAIYTEKQAGSEFNIEIYASDITEASAMGLMIHYPSSMVTVKDIRCQLGEINQSVADGLIRISWVNQSASSTAVDPGKPVLVIHAGTTADYDGREIRFIVDPASHFCDYKGDQTHTRYRLPLIFAQHSFLGNNYPNPFTNLTSIEYTLTCSASVKIKLFNQQGQLVRMVADAEEEAGTHRIEFNSHGLEAGIYYYTLTTSGPVNFSETKKMMIIRQ